MLADFFGQRAFRIVSIPSMGNEENSTPGHPGSVWLRRVPANARGRDFIVGDIHGCLDELIALLAHARFNPKRDRVFSVGDLIDRGPRSADALELLEKPWFFAVRGNHEQMLLDHWQSPEEHPAYDPQWLKGIHPDSIPYYVSLLGSLPHVIKVGQRPSSFYILHAELWDPSQLLTDSAIDDFKFSDPRQALGKILWSRHMVTNHWRDPTRRFHSPDLSRVFCGHTIVQMPTLIERSVYMDTGAFAPYIDPANSQAEHYGLTLVEASTLRHWFAPTCADYRGTVVEMTKLDDQCESPPDMQANQMQPESPPTS